MQNGDLAILFPTSSSIKNGSMDLVNMIHETRSSTILTLHAGRSQGTVEVFPLCNIHPRVLKQAFLMSKFVTQSDDGHSY
jgi:hypothetical protein